MPGEQFVTDADERHPLSRVTEDLGRGQHQDVIVRKMRHGGHIRGLERMSKLPAVIHAEVGQVLHDDGVVFRRQLADDLQFTLFQADPGRVVGIGVHDGGHVTGGELLFQFRTQPFPAVRIDVKLLPGDAEHAKLGFLDGETRIDEQDFVLPGNTLRAGDEGTEGTGHGSRRRNAAGRVDVHVDECLDKTGGRFFQFGNAVRRRILGTDAPFQGFLLRFYAIAVRRQARRTLVHADKRNTRLPFQILGDEQDFTDGSLRKVRDAGGDPRLLDQSFTEDLHSRRRML